ncbi:MAG: GNAT family N-acetyltransferase [Rhodospirillales bacterium]
MRAGGATHSGQDAADQWRIASVGESDSAVLASIHRTAFPDAWDAATLGTFVAQPGGFALLARDRSGVAGGFLLARAVAGESEVLTLAVRPECRRTGCGMGLLTHALVVAAAVGTQRMVLEVSADNGAAQALYLRAGFEIIGRRAGYYRSGAGLPVDALLLAVRWQTAQ